MSLSDQIVNNSILGVKPSLPFGQPHIRGFGNWGNKLWHGRMGTIDNSTASTYHFAVEVQAPQVDAIRFILADTSGTVSDYILIAKASSVANLTDLNNSSGTWTSTKCAGQDAWPLAIAPTTGRSRIQYTLSDIVPVRSVARDDGGTHAIILGRVYIAANSSLSACGDGTDSFTNWASRVDGRMLCFRKQAGDCVTTPSNFTSTTNMSQCPVVGIQYYYQGSIVNTMIVGDSTQDGRGTYRGEGYVMPAVYQVSDATKVLVEFANCAWSGQVGTGINGFYERIIDIVNSEIRPHIIFFPCASVNDFNTGVPANDVVTDALVDTTRMAFHRALAACIQAGVIPVILTWMPTNTSVHGFGVTDSKRVAYNNETLALLNLGFHVVDVSGAVSGVTTGGQVQIIVGYTDDSIHLNDTGNAPVTTLIIPVLRKVIGLAYA